ncbi:MAG: PKD domain-containing protein, partial [Halobaculum sp.]
MSDAAADSGLRAVSFGMLFVLSVMTGPPLAVTAVPAHDSGPASRSLSAAGNAPTVTVENTTVQSDGDAVVAVPSGGDTSVTVRYDTGVHTPSNTSVRLQRVADGSVLDAVDGLSNQSGTVTLRLPAGVQNGTTVSVELRANDTTQANETVTLRVGESPAPAFTVEPAGQFSGRRAVLNASESSDDARLVDYHWTVETADGQTVSLEGERAGYQFTRAGAVEIRLRVTDADGNTATTNQTV